MSRHSAALNDCLIALLIKYPAVLVGTAIASLALLQPASAANSSLAQATVASHLNPAPLAGDAPGTISATAIISTAGYKPQVSLDPAGPVQLAQAITPANDGTGTVVDQADNTFTITGGTQAGANLFHSFEQFGLDAGQIANIIANPDIANVLGRVAGGDPSIINGLLQVTGSNTNLFLINPAGILFGPNSQINVPGIFTATTAAAIQIGDYWLDALGSNDYAKLVSTPSGFAFTSSSPGAIINAGSLNGESVTLLGGSVINTGTINTPGGNITIAAVPGENLVRITQDGSLLSLELPTNVQNSLNSNSQALTALEIPTLLTRGNVPQSLGLVVEESAVKLASTNTPIPTSAGTTIVSGTLDASNQEGIGGRIDVLGERVGLLNADLDASGNSGGGLVRVGGDYQGQGTIPNADNTYVDKNSVISADAVATGNGGQVFVWGDNTTRFFGSISAQGGDASGDGGFIEVSGKEALAYQGQVDLDAPAGRPGQLLLDPAYVTIGFDTINDDELNDGIITGLDGDRFSGNFQISIGKLVDALNSGNVSITASRQIQFNQSLNASSSSHNLSLAAPQILVEGDITLGGSLSLSAGNVQFGNYRGAALEIEATGSITGGNIDTSGEKIGTSGNIDTSAQGGNVTLNAFGDIRTGRITAANRFFNGNLGSISINSGGSFVAREETAPANIRGQSVNIFASRNIITGDIESPRFRLFDRSDALETKVQLSTTSGDIQVGYILAGAGGIDIDAGGHFRALNSIFSTIRQTSVPPSELRSYIDRLGYKEFPYRFDINNFLVSLESVDGSIAIRYGQRENRQNLFSLSVTNSSSVIGLPPVTTTTIEGDPSQAFYVGPNYDDVQPFVPQNGYNFKPFDPVSNPNGYFKPSPYPYTTTFPVTANSQPLVFGTTEFPSNASGIVAGISASRSDASLAGSLQSRVFGDTSSNGSGSTENPPSNNGSGSTENPPSNNGSGSTENPPSSNGGGSIETALSATQNLDIETRNLCDGAVFASSDNSNILRIDESLFISTQTNESRSSVANPCGGTSLSDDQGNTSRGLP